MQPASLSPQRPAAPPFTVGDRFPNFRLPDATGTGRDFYAEVSGRPALMLVARGLSEGPGAALWSLIAAQAPRLAELDLELFAVGGDAPARLAGLMPPKELRHFALQDPDGALLRRFLADQPARLLALDPNQRALAYATGPAAQQLEICTAAVEAWRLAQGEQLLHRGGAPVLMLPGVLPPALCQRLCALWESSNREGQVSAGGADNFYVADRKRNREHDVTDPELTRLIAMHIARRIGPELVKVFNFTQRYTLERFIVLGYTVERQDFFGRHRDRYLPEHPRRFAMSLNLNDDYEGGALRFPEYSQDLYRPPAGGACVFSCSLLHEALPVTRGRRFTMTTFFHAVEGPAPGTT